MTSPLEPTDTSRGGVGEPGPIDPEPRRRHGEISASQGAAVEDPLRGSRTSGTWIAVVALVVLLVLLAIFILQNTRRVHVSFLGWDGSAPLAAMLLIAAAAGLGLAAIAGSLRILQLRRRVKREKKARG